MRPLAAERTEEVEAEQTEVPDTVEYVFKGSTHPDMVLPGLNTNTWSDVPSLKIAVTSPAVVAHNMALYVTGGAILEDGDGIELVQKYDTETGRWTEVAGMLIQRSGSAVCVLCWPMFARQFFVSITGNWMRNF